MTTNPTTDIIANARGVVAFYRTSSNMGDPIVDVASADGSFRLTCDDVDWLCDEIERLRAWRREATEVLGNWEERLRARLDECIGLEEANTMAEKALARVAHYLRFRHPAETVDRLLYPFDRDELTERFPDDH